MISTIKRAWAAAPIAVVILVAALAVTIFFAVRATVFWVYWSDPANRDQQIAAWMTPGYIAHSWYVPREVILEALTAPTGKDARPRNLEQLSELLGIPVDELISRAETAIADYRTLNPPPPREDMPAEDK